jgi:outer membrane protein assembly factor BamD
MKRQTVMLAALVGMLALTSACTNKKSVNPLAKIDSKQPDKVLFDRAMDAMRHNRFDVARLTLQTLINTYPDSEFVARAKLAVGDSWYAEGGTASLAQAEQEFRDFETFFPNMPEAAEAQLKIANIQFQQMEKTDRDYTHTKRAEDEYRNLIMQYPDSKLVPEAKQRLMEVQEALAEREFGIGRFYYLRESYPASIARLQSLGEKYPLYSKADEALYLLGQNYEGETARLRQRPTCVQGGPPGCVTEGVKAKMIESFSKKAGEAYAKILTRYPLMDRADDAKKRLAALQQPIPRPTKAAVAQNRAEQESRRESTTLTKLMSVIKKGPDTARAAKIGEPTLVDPAPVSATEINRAAMQAAVGGFGEKSVTVEKINGDTPGASDPAPRSDAPPVVAPPADATPSADAVPGASVPPPSTTAPTSIGNALKPAAADPNELKPAEDSTPALPPPAQVNEIQKSATTPAQSANAADPNADLASDQDISSSKKNNKKKGLKKIVPF